MNLLFSTVLSNFQLMLNQPVFPGKIILGILLLLSVSAWILIVSKAIQLRGTKSSDVRFTKRLRKAQTVLEVFEEGWKDGESPRHEIYVAGAKEAAFQLLGSKEADATFRKRIEKAGNLSPRQLEMLKEAFLRGERSAGRILTRYRACLQFVSTTALFLGGIGAAASLLSELAGSNGSGNVGTAIAGAAIFLLSAFLVAAPVVLASIVFSAAWARRKESLEQFRVEISRLFERNFSGAPLEESSNEPETDSERPYEIGTPSNERERTSHHDTATFRPKQGFRREYHSIRSTQTSSEGNHQDEENPDLIVNPIAKQTGNY